MLNETCDGPDEFARGEYLIAGFKSANAYMKAIALHPYVHCKNDSSRRLIPSIPPLQAYMSPLSFQEMIKPSYIEALHLVVILQRSHSCCPFACPTSLFPFSTHQFPEIDPRHLPKGTAVRQPDFLPFKPENVRNYLRKG